MDWLSLITTITTIICGGGWFINYHAKKMQAEAESWKSQQDVYQRTIEDLKQSCDYIRKDRDILRKENEELKEENRSLRRNIEDLENQILDLRKEVARNGRRIDALSEEHKKK